MMMMMMHNIQPIVPYRLINNISTMVHKEIVEHVDVVDDNGDDNSVVDDSFFSIVIYSLCFILWFARTGLI